MICGPELYTVNTECILKEFETDSSKVALDELARHLSRKYDDVWQVDPFLFEDLVADVFKQQGFEVTQTQKSKDGGYDLLLMEGTSSIIVEVKRRKTVGVSVVRELMGVQLRDDFKRAKLVTAGRLTRGACAESRNTAAEKYGFEMDLVDAEELLRFLRTYDLPTTLRRSLQDREKMTTEELARQLAGSRWNEVRATEAIRRRIQHAKEVEEKAAHISARPTKPGPPCPECGELLRTSLAKQCLSCGSDWHDRVPN